MKTLQNKKATIKVGDQMVPTSYKELIIACTENIGKGVTTSEIRHLVRIQDAVEDIGLNDDLITLEEQDAEKLIELFDSMKWRTTDKFIIEFEDDLKAMMDE